ncbi:MAG: hypothetical protein JXQ76_12715 [Campylobacterales bacterium]|nr:hypothetical protein [Campylobacterales bacterium]
MKKLMLLVFFAYMLQSCSSSSSNQSTSAIESDGDVQSNCRIISNLQVGERVSYRFNVKGDVSYLSAEVISESNESYTIAFSEEKQEAKYYQWLKGCQSDETLKAIAHDPSKEYILTGIFNSNYYEMVTDSIDDSNTQQDTPGIIEGTMDTTGKWFEEWFEEFTIGSNTYTNVKKIFEEYSNEFKIAYYEEYFNVYTGMNNIPFHESLKSVVSYRDDTNITIELIEWNGL